MSDDKRIKKDDRKLLKQIEEICGKIFNIVMMDDPGTKANLFKFNKEDGSIIMLGFDFVDLNLDENKLGLLGEQVKKLENLEKIIIWGTEEKLLLEWLKELKKIKGLVLLYSHLTTIPEWLKEFNNLEELNLGGNKITILPDWLLTLKDLKYINIRANPIELNQENLNIIKVLFDKFGGKTFKVHAPSSIELYLRHNNIPIEHLKIINEIEKAGEDIRGNLLFSHIKVKEGQLIEWIIKKRKGDILESLPEKFGIIENLQKLTINNSSIVSLPESIGELKELKEVNLSNNQLTSLPESFVNLTSITKLYLNNNKFIEIPTQLWGLKELTEINLSNNPLSDEENNIIQKVPDLIKDYLRKKATIRVFISHAVIDFEPYRIEKLIEFLEKQKEISQVFFCEEDLAGNIDEWMLDAVQKSQLILFIGTNKSVFNSVDCENELQLADKFSIPVIPIKGSDVGWPDLAEKKLSRELGLEFDKNNFDAFCKDLYKYIENMKREIDLMDKDARQKGIMDMYERFRLMLDEKLDGILRKIDGLGERISKLENKI